MNLNINVSFISFTPPWIHRLLEFGEEIRMHGDDYYFSPHQFTVNALSKLAYHPGNDLYYLMITDDKILGYGFLRGWEEGFEVPSLGIAIHPSAQCGGLGKHFMVFLHDMASQKGAEKIRLRVRKDNEKAIKLYKRLSYSFKEDMDNSEYLIGMRKLAQDMCHEK